MPRTRAITKTTHVEVGEVWAEVVRKQIKHMYLGVYPPTGKTKVAVPLNTADDVIKLFILAKLPWIRRQQAKFRGQPRQSKREYVSGESHYFLGKRYRMQVTYMNRPPGVKISKSRMELTVRPGAAAEKRREVIEDFYRTELQKLLIPLTVKWQQTLNIKVGTIRIKKMKTVWGVSNPHRNLIWMNLELAKTQARCLEYILVHEMLHFLERHHTKRFHSLMATYLPQWRQCKSELNSSVLGYFMWDCQVGD